jgi:hypothetical protein
VHSKEGKKMKKLVLTILGVILAILMITGTIVGIATGFTLRLAQQAIIPPTPLPEAPLQIDGNQQLGTLDQELAAILGSIQLSNGIRISQDGITRILGAFLLELNQQPEFRVNRAGVRLDNDAIAITLYLDALVQTQDFNVPELFEPLTRLESIPLVLQFEADIFQEDQSVIVNIKNLAVGTLGIPYNYIERAQSFAINRLSINLEEVPQIQFSSRGMRVEIPIADVNESLPANLRLTSILITPSYLELGIEPDQAFAQELVTQFSTMAKQQGPQVIATVNRYLTKPESRRALEEGIRALSALPANPTEQQIQAAFWNSLEQIRILTQEIITLPDDQALALFEEMNRLVPIEALLNQLESSIPLEAIQ